MKKFLVIVFLLTITLLSTDAYAVTDNAVINGPTNVDLRTEQLYIIQVTPSSENRDVKVKVFGPNKYAGGEITILAEHDLTIYANSDHVNFFHTFAPPLYLPERTYVFEMTGSGLIARLNVQINGEIPPPPVLFPKITFSINKDKFQTNDILIVSGSVENFDKKNPTISIVILHPDGYAPGVDEIISDSGGFTHKFDLFRSWNDRNPLFKQSGTYKIMVSHVYHREDGGLSIDAVIEKSIQFKNLWESSDFIPRLSFNLNQNEYISGDELIVSGIITNSFSVDSSLEIIFVTPDDMQYTIPIGRPIRSGEFSANFLLDKDPQYNKIFEKEGTYKISVNTLYGIPDNKGTPEYGDDTIRYSPISYEKTFVFTKQVETLGNSYEVKSGIITNPDPVAQNVRAGDIPPKINSLQKYCCIWQNKGFNVKLTWESDLPDFSEITYLVQRSVDQKEWVEVYSGLASEYEDSQLNPDSEYYYKITVSNEFGSGQAEFVNIQTPLEPQVNNYSESPQSNNTDYSQFVGSFIVVLFFIMIIVIIRKISKSKNRNSPTHGTMPKGWSNPQQQILVGSTHPNQSTLSTSYTPQFVQTSPKMPTILDIKISSPQEIMIEIREPQDWGTATPSHYLIEARQKSNSVWNQIGRINYSSNIQNDTIHKVNAGYFHDSDIRVIAVSQNYGVVLIGQPSNPKILKANAPEPPTLNYVKLISGSLQFDITEPSDWKSGTAYQYRISFKSSTTSNWQDLFLIPYNKTCKFSHLIPINHNYQDYEFRATALSKINHSVIKESTPSNSISLFGMRQQFNKNTTFQSNPYTSIPASIQANYQQPTGFSANMTNAKVNVLIARNKLKIAKIQLNSAKKNLSFHVKNSQGSQKLISQASAQLQKCQNDVDKAKLELKNAIQQYHQFPSKIQPKKTNRIRQKSSKTQLINAAYQVISQSQSNVLQNPRNSVNRKNKLQSNNTNVGDHSNPKSWKSGYSEWPKDLQFRESIRHPHVCFSDMKLSDGTKLYELKTSVFSKDSTRPLQWSGSHAFVYKLVGNTTSYAIKCFTKPPHGMENQQELSKFFKSNNLDFIIHYETGVEIIISTPENKNTAISWPILISRWVGDENLLDYLDSSKSRGKLKEDARVLSGTFFDIIKKMELIRMAHGDLSGKNIMVQSNTKIILIDYDGMFIPNFKDPEAKELGAAHYQHPERKLEPFDQTIDRFSALVIYLSLLAISEDPTLYYPNHDDKIIFGKTNYAEIRSNKSSPKSNTDEICKKMASSPNPEVRRLFEKFLQILKSNDLKNIPSLSSLISNNKLTQSQ